MRAGILLFFLLIGCRAQTPVNQSILRPRDIIERVDTSMVDPNYFYRSHQ